MTYLCPSCGQEVRVGENCPGCPKPKPPKPKKQRAKPAPRKRSWEQDSYYDSLDLPDEDFDYDEFIEKEFGVTHQRLRIQWHWWVLGILMLIIFAAGAFHLCCG